jgi:D-glycero-alpha-D-manno-heptose-7-phosphate kinase
LTVGVLNALHLLRGDDATPERLAEEACRVEIDILGRPIGRQDQYAAAFGGLNALHFGPGAQVGVEPLSPDTQARAALFESLMVFWTKVSRDAGAVLRAQRPAVLDAE